MVGPACPVGGVAGCDATEAVGARPDGEASLAEAGTLSEVLAAPDSAALGAHRSALEAAREGRGCDIARAALLGVGYVTTDLLAVETPDSAGVTVAAGSGNEVPTLADGAERFWATGEEQGGATGRADTSPLVEVAVGNAG